MSAPEVGDRVRVHGEPYRGDFGYVADPAYVASAYLWDLWVTLDGDTGPHGFALNEVEKVPTTPMGGHRGDEMGALRGSERREAMGGDMLNIGPHELRRLAAIIREAGTAISDADMHPNIILAYEAGWAGACQAIEAVASVSEREVAP